MEDIHSRFIMFVFNKKLRSVALRANRHDEKEWFKIRMDESFEVAVSCFEEMETQQFNKIKVKYMHRMFGHMQNPMSVLNIHTN